MTPAIKYLIVAGVIVVLATSGLILVQHRKPAPAPKNFYTITDEPAKLKFNVSKNFEPIPKAELASLNPGFNYGFKSKLDPSAQCIVAQSQLKGSGQATPADLRDGLIAEIKKVHPDVELENPQSATKLAKFGQGQGVLLQLSYKEEAVKIRRVEVIALGKSTQVVAYCNSPLELAAKYYPDFTTFFSSLKITG
jgi:hypothetical protein